MRKTSGSPLALLNKGAIVDQMRKGPWTEQEDKQLVWFVKLFGERRWDFLAKVSGLYRTGKSCRLRWVNYLHPGLKHGRMTPQEERLVLELHHKWGNRWSKIASKLPGRTDNEIKNYWRTHMRRSAQAREQSFSPSPSESSLSDHHSSVNDNSAEETCGKTRETDCGTSAENFTSQGSDLVSGTNRMREECNTLMDQIWKEIAACEPIIETELNFEEHNYKNIGSSCSDNNINTCLQVMASSPMCMWEDCAGSLWRIDDEDQKTTDLMVRNYQYSN